MVTWPIWVWIGLIIFNVIARIAMIGKESKVKVTAGGAIVNLVISSVLIVYMVEITKHLC